ncbi:hypothetical protein SLEP1_g58644 [Rubroshorea leprosula]|uniref:NmrA-like domain-containing protein n=1 Tax=Rubroshorea leprosula TaxID=152421 RepID=A0AAV5MR60_9ROSI|nr:hypothetical protein SLEP1_g58644 [Rubroshorea leprosula]
MHPPSIQHGPKSTKLGSPVNPSDKSRRERFKPITALQQTSVETTKASSFRSKNPKDINILAVGSTGYTGEFVVHQLVDWGSML